MIIIVSDIHLGSGLNLGLNRELDLIESLDQTINYAIKKKVRYFVSLGDNFDRPNPSNYLRKLFADRLYKLSENKIRTFILIGNHEFANRHHALSSISNLKIDKVNIVDKPSRMLNKDSEWIFLPHNVSIDSKAVTWNKIFGGFKINEKNKRRIILGHFPVTGSKVGLSDFRLEANVNKRMLKKLNADLIFLGDIHVPQKLFPNCYYVGSIDRINFGERREQKSFIHVTKDWEVKRIKIDNRPLIQFDVGSDKYKDVKGAIVKPIIECDESDINKFNTAQILEKFKSSKAHFVMPFEWNITESKKKQGRKITQEINIEDYLRKYIKRNHKKKNVNRLVKLYATAKVKDS